MITPELDLIENSRMDELRELDILDSLTEKDYDDITKLASIICETPVALISFVDTQRQWFKSTIGVDGLTETPREYSFCSIAIQNPTETLIVEDSRLDHRFMHNPLVTGETGIVFYAGVPLVTQNGFGLGSVCVIDKKPRTLTSGQIDGLQILATQIMNLLELRRANLGLKRAEETLDRSLTDRTRELAEKNLVLEKMNSELQAFTYISSHDLQEPLRKIQTFTSWIIEKDSKNLTEKGQEYLFKIGQSSSRMSTLISDLLNYSRATTTERVFETISLRKIVDHVKEDLEDEITNKNATIELLRDSEMRIIPFQFRQLIYNLVSNSLKFSRPEVDPTITISSEFKSGKIFNDDRLTPEKMYHRISISDNGIGFDSKYSEKIFQLFQRLGTRQVQIGTGIGLAIVKKIVENHKGLIVAESGELEGATFHVYIPEHIEQ
ncbi:MAG: sensor histidine kinase [Flavobacterium sp.]|uniref:GAF domain-containing sensor histidine kinase n=1 Tax=Flavobacterium sp. TaxID=239 RepID=UPI00120DA584|nr:ATP-binding protein [Flavobacterium sp.]RZJ68215.1 MAG: sensor histidine kinase [Flavobacterium sp.]